MGLGFSGLLSMVRALLRLSSRTSETLKPLLSETLKPLYSYPTARTSKTSKTLKTKDDQRTKTTRNTKRQQDYQARVSDESFVPRRV